MRAAKPSADTIIQEIKIKAPAKKLFTALTSPEELVQWWGMKGTFQATHAECDVRVGGIWKMRVATNAGGETNVGGVYRKIVRPKLLVYTWMREADKVETLVRWDLEEKKGLTTVRVTHSGLATESLRTRNNGWPMILGLLQDFLDSGS